MLPPLLSAVLVAVSAAVPTKTCGRGAPAGSPPCVPDWEPTYDMSRSTVFMPCNVSGFTDPAVYKGFGLVDFDWSNGKAAWSTAQPMDCEERLVTQATMTKSMAKDTKVFVYRNLVKALPWYTSVREKITDPAYSGWFLKFKPGGSMANGSWHSPPCTTDASGHKCSLLYHDQDQTPEPPPHSDESTMRTQHGDWFVYNSTNDVCGLTPGKDGVVNAGTQRTWQACMAAADRAGKPVWGWWPDGATGGCFLASSWTTKGPGCAAHLPIKQAAHVSGFKPKQGEPPPPALGSNRAPQNCASGICDCGIEFPCGEYLWDHRNGSMLRDFLVNEFVLGPNGLGNPDIDGFYLDDSWHTAPQTAPTTPWSACSQSPVGGATEENPYCSEDIGLTASDVADITSNWSATVAAAQTGAMKQKGFLWGSASEFVGTGARSIAPSRWTPHVPNATCAQDLRRHCAINSSFHEGALLFEFTRKTFQDPFPLPTIVQDLAQFLLVRGEFAWLGHNWMGCFTPKNEELWVANIRPKQLDEDYGVPLDEYCHETSTGSGIFQRRWSKAGTVEMDCNTYTAKIPLLENIK